MWALFLSLSRRRQGGFSGGQPLLPSEVESYGRLTGREIERWEAAAVLALDDVYLDVTREQREAQASGGG